MKDADEKMNMRNQLGVAKERRRVQRARAKKKVSEREEMREIKFFYLHKRHRVSF